VEADLSWQSIVGRLLLAALLGGAIGFEREADGHDAGLRTHMILALGSALFAVASVGAFDPFEGTRNETNFTVDVTRMAAYVAPGVGFIGAGVIVKNVQGRRRAALVRGLTTAASLWTAAAVGVAAGLGFWIGAVATATIALFALVGMRPIAEMLHPEQRRPPQLELEIHVDDRAPLDAATLVSAVRAVAPAGPPPEAQHDGDVRSFRFPLGALPPESVDALVSALAEQPGVRLVRVREP
jgi:putative Mg2+ transporter-C (MgtC) family protein